MTLEEYLKEKYNTNVSKYYVYRNTKDEYIQFSLAIYGTYVRIYDTKMNTSVLQKFNVTSRFVIRDQNKYKPISFEDINGEYFPIIPQVILDRLKKNKTLREKAAKNRKLKKIEDGFDSAALSGEFILNGIENKVEIRDEIIYINFANNCGIVKIKKLVSGQYSIFIQQDKYCRVKGVILVKTCDKEELINILVSWKGSIL